MSARGSLERLRRGRALALLALCALAGTLAGVGVGAGCAPRHGMPPSYDATDAQRRADAIALIERAQDERDPQKQIVLYERAVAAYREFPAVWNELGMLYHEQQDYARALDAFTTAANLDPDDPRPLVNLGVMWDKRFYPEVARKHYESALARSPRNIDALRGCIRCDVLLNEQSQTTLDRVVLAMSIEKDDRWLNWFSEQRIRIEKRLQEQASGLGSPTVP